jgi:hypothetical protein
MLSGRPAGIIRGLQVDPRTTLTMNCNSGAEMLVLNVGRFADLGMGNVPKHPTVRRVRAARNAPQVLRRDGDAGRRKKNARALKFARKQAQVFLKGAD